MKNNLIIFDKGDLFVGFCFIINKSQDGIISPTPGKQDVFNLLRRITVTSGYSHFFDPQAKYKDRPKY